MEKLAWGGLPYGGSWIFSHLAQMSLYPWLPCIWVFSSPRSSGTLLFFSKYTASHSKDHWRWILNCWSHGPFDFLWNSCLYFQWGNRYSRWPQITSGPRRRLDGKTWQQFLPPSSETSAECWSSVIHAKGCFLQFLFSSPAFPLLSSPTGRGKAAMLIERLIS